MIFVFGSNESGWHGAGAALHALTLGARTGQGFGPSGQTFAIPTKDWGVRTLPLMVIQGYVHRFLEYAALRNGQDEYQVTAIGCGLAGYSHEEVARLFRDAAPRNVLFDERWAPYLCKCHHRFWGTF
jgi:hypothetical protein